MALVAVVLLLFAGLVFYALRPGRDVKAGVKISFASFSSPIHVGGFLRFYPQVCERFLDDPFGKHIQANL